MSDLFIYALPAFALLMVIEWIDHRRDPDRPANGLDRPTPPPTSPPSCSVASPNRFWRR
ncbi:hypothetical protein [Nocardia yunnanensis]|uniref:hypothetical protein n=1 Tax=Nocardia yunnanensis TaxID=2382165 RepID=UPI001FED116D|nr:hypothetical protein [Nocardia yunnanensis]